MIMTNLKHVDLEDVILSMKEASPDIFMLRTNTDGDGDGSRTNCIFVSDEFLNKFEYSDDLYIGPRRLSPTWGHRMVGTVPGLGGLVFVSSELHAYEDMVDLGHLGLRCRIIKSSLISDLQSEIKAALEFERNSNIEALSLNEILAI